MSKKLPNKNLISITQTAAILGVSKRTLQRWVKTGKLHAIRPSGKECYFTAEEIEKHRQNDLLSVEEAAKRLGVSIEEFLEYGSKGLITRVANGDGQFGYTTDSVEQLLHTLFYIQQKAKHEHAARVGVAAQENDPDKLIELLAAESAADDPVEQKVIGTVVSQDRHYIHKLQSLQRVVVIIILAVGLFLGTIVLVITLFFLIVPEETGAFFGYTHSTVSQQVAKKRVLGAHVSADEPKSEHFLGTLLKPFSKVALALVKQIDEKKHDQIVPEKTISDINDVLALDEQGNIVVLANLKLPDSSYLVTSDGELLDKLKVEVESLASSLQTHEKTVVETPPPSTENTSINILPGQITSSELATGAVLTDSIADGAVTAKKLATGIGLLGDNTVSSAFIKDGEVKSEDIADGSVGSAKLADSAVTDSKLSQITSSQKVAGSAVQLAAGGGLTNNTGLSLLQTCTDGQALTWNALSSEWECSSIAGGGGDITTVVAGTGLTGGGNTGSVTLNAVLGTDVALASEVTGVLPVANGGTGASTLIDLITLGTHTTGNYVGSITNGSGISIGGSAGEAWVPSISLGGLTGDWNQTGAFDIVLGHASSELRLLESTGGAFYGTFDVGDLAADQVYTFGIGGTVYTSGNDPYDTAAEIQAVATGGDVTGALSNIQIGSGAVGTNEAAGLDISDDTNLSASDGVTLTGDALTNSDKGSSQNIFKTISVSGQSDVVTDTNSDALTLVGGSNVTITTDASTDTITISAATGGTYSAGNDLDLTGSTFDLESVIDTVSTINLAGTGTLNGLDVIDATTESTIESSIDMLSNLTAASSLVSVGTLTSGSTGTGFTLNFGTSTLSGNITGSNIDESSLSGLTSSNFTSANVSQWTNDAGYITDGNTGWDNSYGFITDGNSSWDNSYGFITASSTDALTNKSGNISMWTNDAGYLNAVDVSTNTNLSAGNGVSLAGDALSLDQSYAPSWSGLNTFTRANTQLLLKPASAPVANTKLLDVQQTGAGTTVFSIDYEGDVVANTLSLVTALTDANVSDALTISSSGSVDAAALAGTIASARLSGTYGIDISGNAATVTNGVYTSGSYADPAWITSLAGSKVSGNISGNAANVTGTVSDANVTDALTISGGTVDNTVIGGTTAAAGTFTALTAHGNAVLGDGAGNDSITLRKNGTGNVTFTGFASCSALETDGSGNLTCGTDDTGGGTGSLDVAYDNGRTVTVDAGDVVFDLSDATNDYKFTINNNTSGSIATGLAVTTSVASGTYTTALDLSDADIATALALGANDITVNGITIDATELARLNGIDAAIVDINDAVGTAITGTGTLTSGSTGTGFTLNFGTSTLSGNIGGGNIDESTLAGLTTSNFASANISQWTNNAGYITDGNTNWDNSYGFITASSTDALTNKSGNISMWTNDSGYLTSVANGNLSNDTVDLTKIADSLTLDNTLTFVSDNATNDYKLVIDNSSTGDIAELFEVTTSGVGGTIGTALDLSDADIATALALGANDITVNGVTIDATEFARLNGVNAALIDTNDAVATAITGTGTLTAGSTGTGFTLNFGTSTLSGDVTGSNISGVDVSSDTNLSASDGITLTGDALTNSDKGSSQNIFKTIAVSGQNNVVTDANGDTLTLVAGSNVTITTDDATDSITIAAASGGTYTAGNDLDLTGNTFDLESTLDIVSTINLAGTGTLNGLDAIDATTESTIETAIDTLSNLTGVGTLTSGATGTGFTIDFTNSTLSGNVTGANISGVDISNDTNLAATDGVTLTGDSLSLAATTAGNGLTYATGVLAVGAGTGISVAADSISATLGTSVDTSEVDADTLTLADVSNSLTLDNNLTFGSDNSTTDYKLVFDNSSTGDIATLLQVTTTGVGGTITTALDLSDADIATGLALGSNDVTVNGVTISAAEFGLLDSGVALSELTDSGTLTAGTVDINGGAIDGSTIGANSAAAGTFTDLTANGNAILGDGTGNDSITIRKNGTGNVTFTGFASCTALETDGSGNLTCGTDDTGAGGGITTIQHNDSDAVTSATTIDFLGSDFDVTANGGEGDIAIDYTNSGIARKNQSETVQNDWTFSFAEGEDLAINLAVSGTNAGTGETITLTNTSSSGNQYGLVIDNAASSGATDALLVLDNSDADTAVTAAIQIINAGGGFTNLFDVAGTGISVAEFTILDSGLALSELTDLGTLTAATVDINGGSIDGTTIGATTRAAASVTDLDANGLSVLGDGTGADNITFNPGSGTITFTGFTSCSALETNGSGQLVCGVDNTGAGGGSSNWTLDNGVLRPNNNTADVLIGGTATGSAKFAFMNLNNNSGEDPLASFSGDLRIGPKPNSNPSALTTWTKVSQATSGTIANGGTALIASISASAVYNGNLYVGTHKGTSTGEAEIYRYNGGTSWTKVSQATAGQIANGGTSNIASVSAMTVFDGRLYAGTSKVNEAEIYRYDGGTTWTRVSHPTTAGTIGTTTAQDGISALGVNNGILYAGTREGTPANTPGTGARLLRFEGGNSWTAINTTAGQFVATNTVGVYAVTAIQSYGGQLFIGVSKSGDADLLRYIGATGTGPFLSMNAAGLTGSYSINGANVTAFDEITAMTVYNNTLLVALKKNNAAELLALNTNAPITAANAGFTRFNTVGAGNINGSTTNIDAITAMTVYNGVLYLGTMEGNSAEIYRYAGGSLKFQKVSGTAGTVGGSATTGIDGISLLVPYNGSLFAGTFELGQAEIYSHTFTNNQSYELQFHANPAIVGENNGQPNIASFYYVASASANLGSSNAYTGALVSTHGIQTRIGSYDVAEDYATRDDSLEPGDVVSIDSAEDEFVKKSEGAYDHLVVGVYSSNPALRLSQLDPSINGVRAIPVALAGRVPVKVSTENGPIKPGDFLTASSVSGVAMKATKSGVVFGQAMSEFNDEGIGRVTVYIKSSTYQGSVAADVASFQVDVKAASGDILASLLEQNITEPGSEVVTDRVIAGLDVIAPKIVADEIIAKTIKADRIEGLEIYTDKIASLEEAVLGLQNVGPSTIASESAALEESVTSTVVATEEVSLQSLFVEGIATISGQLTSDKVRVKDSLLVEAFAHVADTLTSARLIVNDIATFFGKVIFKDDVAISGKLSVGKDTAGIAVIKKGTDQVEVTFEEAYEYKPVITISLSVDEDEEDLEALLLQSDIKYIITKRSKNGFIIKLNKEATQDIRFSWTAVSAADEKVELSSEKQFVTPTIVVTETPNTPTPSLPLTPTPGQN